MGKVADQFEDVVSATNSNVAFVNMWIGPRNRTEIEKTIAGYPTLVPCCVGPNLNDGDGVHGFKKRKGFMTLEEMHRWVKDQKPDQQQFPCPYCPEDGQFIGKTANELAAHIKDDHKPDNLISTFDAEGAKESAINEVVEKKLKKEKHRPVEFQTEKPSNVTPVAKDLSDESMMPAYIEDRCAATKSDGEQCTKEAKSGSNYCGITSHQKQEDTEVKP